MARRTAEQAAVMPEFPYRNAKTHPAWAVIEQALQDLAANNDLELQTPPRYVIGYLIESLVNRGLLPPHRPKREKTVGRREGKIKSMSR